MSRKDFFTLRDRGATSHDILWKGLLTRSYITQGLSHHAIYDLSFFVYPLTKVPFGVYKDSVYIDVLYFQPTVVVTMSSPDSNQNAASPLPKTRPEWQKALESLPSDPSRIPAFFFGHGSPLLEFPESALPQSIASHAGPNGPLANFLRDFGPALLDKYKPKGILVFSAHWETSRELLGMWTIPSYAG
jgi:hypothetical protein